jgi:hypothetical protein
MDNAKDHLRDMKRRGSTMNSTSTELILSLSTSDNRTAVDILKMLPDGLPEGGSSTSPPEEAVARFPSSTESLPSPPRSPRPVASLQFPDTPTMSPDEGDFVPPPPAQEDYVSLSNPHVPELPSTKSTTYHSAEFEQTRIFS